MDFLLGCEQVFRLSCPPSPASQPAPGIDPASIEEVLSGVRDLRGELAGLREAESAERPAALSEALSLEALEAWGDKLVARVAEAARPADAPEDEAAATRIKRMEDAAAKAEAAAERIDGGLASTADRVATKIEEAVTRIEKGLATTRAANRTEARQANPTLGGSRTRTAGPRFGRWTGFACLFFFVFGLLVESRAHLFYLWLWAG